MISENQQRRLINSASACGMLLPLALVVSLCPAPTMARDPDDPVITGISLGFEGVYKLGCWTQAEIQVEAGDQPYSGRVIVTVADADGVPTSVATADERPIGLVPGQSTSARLFVRSGQDGADITVRFVDDAGHERARRRFNPGDVVHGRPVGYGLPATDRLIVTFGLRQGLSELSVQDRAADQPEAVHLVRVNSADVLPLEWYGYESVDLVVLGSSSPELYRPLAANPQRVAALRRWVELGGRVVIFCGPAAQELIGSAGPLAELIPGRFETLAPLRVTQPLETFSGAEDPLNRGRIELQVPKLAEVRGRILAHGGNEPTDLPLVIRARHGLGEITFVGVDLDAPPIAQWNGRASLVRQALQWHSDALPTSEDQGGVYVSQGAEDLIDQLRTALDQQFTNVKTAPFALVAGLVLLYIAAIGPGDYFLVKRILKRMELTWITFPTIVVGVSIAAYYLAYWMKGDQLRVNQVEVIDVDLTANQARGTIWTHFFSPRVERYDLTIASRFAGKSLETPAAHRLVAWLGNPGYGLGGMQGQSGQVGMFDAGYFFSPKLESMRGLPVQEWSTKTLVGRWTAPLQAPIESALQLLPDDLLSGTIVNRTDQPLDSCILMHGNWAYSLGTIGPGETATLNDAIVPRPVRTTLTGATAGELAAIPTGDDGGVPFDPTNADVVRIAKLMMFYEAAGGRAYARMPHRYQAFVDLSRLLDGEQAILLARGAGDSGSHWSTADGPLASDQDRRWLFYRFVIPLEEGEP